jgi:uncharacterized small protein (DUF1192 family)
LSHGVLLACGSRIARRRARWQGDGAGGTFEGRALEESMAFDPLADDKPRPKPTHELGQDLSTLSVHELDERIALLEAEIARLAEARGRKEASKNAASAFFKA